MFFVDVNDVESCVEGLLLMLMLNFDFDTSDERSKYLLSDLGI